jgi:hypothetical protein
MSYPFIHHDGIVLEIIHNYNIPSSLSSKYMIELKQNNDIVLEAFHNYDISSKYMTELNQLSFDFVKYEEMKKKIQKSKPKSDITYQKREQLLPKLTKSKFRKN